MGDRNVEYDGKFGFYTFKREIIAELGEAAWQELVENRDLPDIENESKCGCRNMYAFMKAFDEKVDNQTANKTLSRVRHGLKPSQTAWASEKLLQYGDLDAFIKASIAEGIADFEKLNREDKDFYGQPITDEVLAFVKENPEMLSGRREGNLLYFMAFPANMKDYLTAKDERMTRYHACHCPFAKESILTEETVSATLCYCSLGHIKNFWEAAFDQEIEGEVIASVLKGELSCRYVVTIPEDIMERFVK